MYVATHFAGNEAYRAGSKHTPSRATWSVTDAQKGFADARDGKTQFYLPWTQHFQQLSMNMGMIKYTSNDSLSLY